MVWAHYFIAKNDIFYFSIIKFMFVILFLVIFKLFILCRKYFCRLLLLSLFSSFVSNLSSTGKRILVSTCFFFNFFFDLNTKSFFKFNSKISLFIFNWPFLLSYNVSVTYTSTRKCIVATICLCLNIACVQSKFPLIDEFKNK